MKFIIQIFVAMWALLIALLISYTTIIASMVALLIATTMELVCTTVDHFKD